MTQRIAAFLIVLAGTLSLASASAQPPRPTPYWASISSGRAMMRTGPGQNFPGIWEYRRADLPIRVVEIYHDWRKIEDPGGTTGWMLVRLLSDQRTAIVREGQPRPMHEAPDEGTPVRFHAAPGVVGRVSRCADGWCRFDVRGRNGYIRVSDVWGVEASETIR
jgi:SH3-like domain-containing protein